MNLSKTLNLSAEQLYHKIIHSVLEDIKNSTGEALNEDQLSGFTYRKNFSRGQYMDITIGDCISNQVYQYTAANIRNEYAIQYQIEKKDSHTCTLNYSENMISHGKFQQFNDKLVGFFLSWSKKRQFLTMLKQIEKSESEV
ncbi:hypothetical protein FACS189418_5280 [Clostridia bacterium]|nr:hypothetical protein FACS189418_5280 [Clostridia bacterium]